MTHLRPVAISALVASLGFVTMALATELGRRCRSPLATDVVGGLISATLLTRLLRRRYTRGLGPRRSDAPFGGARGKRA